MKITLQERHMLGILSLKYNIDKATEESLVELGWQVLNKQGLPTRKQVGGNYFRPFSGLYFIASHIHLNTKLISIGRKGVDKMKKSEKKEGSVNMNALFIRNTSAKSIMINF